MVFAAVIPLGRWRPAKLAAPHNERLVEQSAGLQIGQQRGNRAIHRAATLRQVFAQAAMVIPDVVGRGVKELHEPHAALDQPPCEQALPSKQFRFRIVRAVKRMRGLRLGRKIERLGRRTLHLKRQLEGRDAGVELTVLFAFLAMEFVELP